MKKIRVLVVDDSAFMRRALTQILETAGDIEVVDTARDGEEGLAKALTLQPDVVTLDINMPKMDGLTLLSHLVEKTAARVVMVSSLTQEGALVTLEALALGAVDFVAKPGGTVSLGIKKLADEVITKVRAAARARMRPLRRAKPAPKGETGTLSSELRWLVVIGVSTGGPRTIEEILPAFSSDLPAGIVVVQHMPPPFTSSLAQRLDQHCRLQVREAEEGMLVQAGTVTIARGGFHLVFRRLGRELSCHLTLKPEETLFRPSVDVTLRAAIESYHPQRIIGVILTGMGDDGASAMVELRRRGGYTVAESEETAIVWGMPRAAIERGGAEVVAPSYRIAQIIEEKVRNG
ncbi:MAG: protein-glutamate methylesterase/protein-glutamine glutaminase [Moorellaceae bacterium]